MPFHSCAATIHTGARELNVEICAKYMFTKRLGNHLRFFFNIIEHFPRFRTIQF